MRQKNIGADRKTGGTSLKCLKVPRRDNMLMCLECGGIAYKNSYFGVATCQSCGWRVSIKEYEELEN